LRSETIKPQNSTTATKNQTVGMQTKPNSEGDEENQITCTAQWSSKKVIMHKL